MDASWVAAIASVASAFVVGVAAIAALLQLRHIRNANDIATYLHLVDRLDSANAFVAFEAIETLAQDLRSDPALRQRMMHQHAVSEFAEIQALLRFLDSQTMLIVAGSVSEPLILAKYADEIVRLWDAVAEAVYLRRYVLGPHFASVLEHLAMRANASLESGEIERFYSGLERDPRMGGFTPPEP
jgi:hypothetical protein